MPAGLPGPLGLWRRPTLRAVRMLVLRGGSGDIVAEQEALGDHGARAPEHLANYSLVQRQRAHIEEALMHVGRAVDPAEAGATLPFKALLYDPHWRDILALSMPVSELCLHGVLAHGTLHQASEASSEAAPAVYLVQPTRANLDLVAQDAERRAFRSAQGNPIEPARAPKLIALVMHPSHAPT